MVLVEPLRIGGRVRSELLQRPRVCAGALLQMLSVAPQQTVSLQVAVRGCARFLLLSSKLH